MYVCVVILCFAIAASVSLNKHRNAHILRSRSDSIACSLRNYLRPRHTTIKRLYNIYMVSMYIIWIYTIQYLSFLNLYQICEGRFVYRTHNAGRSCEKHHQPPMLHTMLCLLYIRYFDIHNSAAVAHHHSPH